MTVEYKLAPAVVPDGTHRQSGASGNRCRQTSATIEVNTVDDVRRRRTPRRLPLTLDAATGGLSSLGTAEATGRIDGQ